MDYDRRLTKDMEIDIAAASANQALPIFAAHCSEDDVVSIELGIRARDFLTARGHPVEWHEYPMPHSICIEATWSLTTDQPYANAKSLLIETWIQIADGAFLVEYDPNIDEQESRT